MKKIIVFILGLLAVVAGAYGLSKKTTPAIPANSSNQAPGSQNGQAAYTAPQSSTATPSKTTKAS